MSEPQQPQEAPKVAVVPGGEPGGEAIEQPGKLIRIASMIRGLIEEVQKSSLDDRARGRLAEIYRRSVSELSEVLSDDLRTELQDLAPPLEEPVTESEVRVAQAQLLGWLEGLFHGIQAALWSQQMQARAALEEMRRRSLPSGMAEVPTEHPEEPGHPGRPGQYL